MQKPVFNVDWVILSYTFRCFFFVFFHGFEDEAMLRNLSILLNLAFFYCDETPCFMAQHISI